MGCVPDDASTVQALLHIAGLTVSDDELGRFVRLYPLLRSQADALLVGDVADEEPAVRFDATIGLAG